VKIEYSTKLHWKCSHSLHTRVTQSSACQRASGRRETAAADIKLQNMSSSGNNIIPASLPKRLFAPASLYDDDEEEQQLILVEDENLLISTTASAANTPLIRAKRANSISIQNIGQLIEILANQLSMREVRNSPDSGVEYEIHQPLWPTGNAFRLIARREQLHNNSNNDSTTNNNNNNNNNNNISSSDSNPSSLSAHPLQLLTAQEALVPTPVTPLAAPKPLPSAPSAISGSESARKKGKSSLSSINTKELSAAEQNAQFSLSTANIPRDFVISPLPEEAPDDPDLSLSEADIAPFYLTLTAQNFPNHTQFSLKFGYHRVIVQELRGSGTQSFYFDGNKYKESFIAGIRGDSVASSRVIDHSRSDEVVYNELSQFLTNQILMPLGLRAGRAGLLCLLDDLLPWTILRYFQPIRTILDN
jgi:hypothetical protein